MKNQLSIVICTFNRASLLRFCLQSFAEQKCDLRLFEVLIIDNNSTDSTSDICKEFITRYSNFKYIKEKNQGLGYARNRGYKESQAKWVAYVDDDAKAHPNYVERALWVISNCSFQCFGGVYNAWFTVAKPKWIDENFGTNRAKQIYLGILDNGYMDGGNMVWEKLVLEKLGGFHTEIGMKGTKISYGEETYIQEIAREQKIRIGFDPSLQIDHFVQPYKLKIFWHLRSAYAMGFDYWQTFNKIPTRKDESFWNYQNLFRQFVKDFFQVFKKFSKNNNYHWQNFLLEKGTYYAIQLGKIKSAKKLLKLYRSK